VDIVGTITIATITRRDGPRAKVVRGSCMTPTPLPNQVLQSRNVMAARMEQHSPVDRQRHETKIKSSAHQGDLTAVDEEVSALRNMVPREVDYLPQP